MPTQEYLERKKIAAKKIESARWLMKKQPNISNQEINERFGAQFGSMIDGSSLAKLREELGISGPGRGAKRSKRKKTKRKKSKGKNTKNLHMKDLHDIGVLKQPKEVDTELSDAIDFLYALMIDNNIQNIHMNIDGDVSIERLTSVSYTATTVEE